MKYLLPLLFIGALSCSTKESANDVSMSSSPTLSELWTTDTTSLLTPESVLYDAMRDQLIVSCINGVPPTAVDGDGYLALLNSDGTLKNAQWFTGLNAPKGMGLKDSLLYVTDITELKVININTGTLVKSITVPGSEFLNDVDISSTGEIFFTDSNTSTIYTLNAAGEPEVFLQDAALGGSNGILANGDELLIAGFGSGAFHSIQKADKKLTLLADSLMGGDGIVKYGKGYLVSNWNGEVSYTENGTNTLLLDTKNSKRNAADIALKGDNILLVPEFFANKVTAYTIK